MAKKKLFRFSQIREFENVHEHPEGMQGNWHSFFKNENPIVLELACGRGEYTIGLAELHPDKNFIGVDIKGNRMYIGAKKALESKLYNAAFLRTQIEQIADFFAAGEVDEIWITFPDPQLRVSKAKKRLTHPRFLRLYQQFLKPGNFINLKTDSPDLFEFTKKVINMYDLNLVAESENAYAEKEVSENLKIKTHYESLDIARSNKIHYLRFSLLAVIADHDKELQRILESEKEPQP